MQKKNYLLIMPKCAAQANGLTVFPLGVAYISAYLKQFDFNIYTLNLNYCEDVEKDLVDFIKTNQINVTMVGGLSAQFSILKNIIDIIQNYDENIIQVVGGGIITADPKVAMEALMYADIGIMGEGEITAYEMCKALENGTDLASVEGLVYKSGSDIIVNPEREDIADLDALPFPDYEGFAYDKYVDTIKRNQIKETEIIVHTSPLIASRSCPYNCSFCFHTSGKKYRKRSLDNIMAEIDYLVNKYQISYLTIQDELFASDKNRLNEFCQRIKAYHLKWTASFRVDGVDAEVMKQVRDAGCVIAYFGVESADNNVLKSMRKHITVEQITNTLQLLCDIKMPFQGNLIFGERAETMETVENSIKWWREHPHFDITLNIIKPYPGSLLYRYAVANNIITDPIQYLKDGCPEVNVSQLSDEEFANLSQRIVELPSEVLSKSSDYRFVNNKFAVTCSQCGHVNEYNTFVSFSGVVDWKACPSCGRRTTFVMNEEIVDILDKKMEQLLAKHGSVAIWALNYLVIDYLHKSKVVPNENVYVIDISKIRQASKISGKSVCDPNILEEKGIRCVVVGTTAHRQVIESQIKKEFHTVDHVTEMSDLLSDVVGKQ